MQNFENMTKKTKMILSIVGVAAVVLPALLLIIASSRTAVIPQVSNSKRQIDTSNIENTVRKTTIQTPPASTKPVIVPTPSPILVPTPSPKAPEGSQSAR